MEQRWWAVSTVSGHWVTILGHGGFSVQATDAIIIGHSCPVPASPALQLSGSVRALRGWRTGGPGFQLCRKWVRSPSQSASWASNQAPPSPKVLRRQPQTASSCECVKSLQLPWTCLVRSERTISSPRGRTPSNVLKEQKKGPTTHHLGCCCLPSKKNSL